MNFDQDEVENFGDQVATDEQLAVLTQNVLQLEETPAKNSPITANASKQHWLVYPEEKIPEYIIEAKKRLNQIRQPNEIANIRQVRISDEPTVVLDQSVNNEKRHWLTWPNPATPEKIREIRGRLGDDRYKRMTELKSMFRRPKTAFHSINVPVRQNNVSFFF